MTQKFNDFFNQIINEAKIKQKSKQDFQYFWLSNNLSYSSYNKHLGLICPVCGERTLKVTQFGDKKYFTCKFFPRCHGRAPFIDENSQDPTDLAIIENAKLKEQEELAELEIKKQEEIARKKEEAEKRKAEAEKKEAERLAKKEALIKSALTPNQKVVMSAIDGRISNVNAAYDDYHTYYAVIEFVETLGDKNIFNVYKRNHVKTHYGDSIPYQSDYELTNDIEGTAYSTTENPLTVYYKRLQWDIFEIYNPEKEYSDTYQPSTFGT